MNFHVTDTSTAINSSSTAIFISCEKLQTSTMDNPGDSMDDGTADGVRVFYCPRFGILHLFENITSNAIDLH